MLAKISFLQKALHGSPRAFSPLKKSTSQYSSRWKIVFFLSGNSFVRNLLWSQRKRTTSSFAPSMSKLTLTLQSKDRRMSYPPLVFLSLCFCLFCVALFRCKEAIVLSVSLSFSHKTSHCVTCSQVCTVKCFSFSPLTCLVYIVSL